MPHLTLTTSTSSLSPISSTSPIFSTVSPAHKRPSAHDLFLPCDVPRQSGGSTQIPSLTSFVVLAAQCHVFVTFSPSFSYWSPHRRSCHVPRRTGARWGILGTRWAPCRVVRMMQLTDGLPICCRVYRLGGVSRRCVVYACGLRSCCVSRRPLIRFSQTYWSGSSWFSEVLRRPLWLSLGPGETITAALHSPSEQHDLGRFTLTRQTLEVTFMTERAHKKSAQPLCCFALRAPSVLFFADQLLARLR